MLLHTHPLTRSIVVLINGWPRPWFPWWSVCYVSHLGYERRTCGSLLPQTEPGPLPGRHCAHSKPVAGCWVHWCQDWRTRRTGRRGQGEHLGHHRSGDTHSTPVTSHSPAHKTPATVLTVAVLQGRGATRTPGGSVPAQEPTSESPHCWSHPDLSPPLSSLWNQ